MMWRCTIAHTVATRVPWPLLQVFAIWGCWSGAAEDCSSRESVVRKVQASARIGDRGIPADATDGPATVTQGVMLLQASTQIGSSTLAPAALEDVRGRSGARAQAAEDLALKFDNANKNEIWGEMRQIPAKDDDLVLSLLSSAATTTVEPGGGGALNAGGVPHCSAGCGWHAKCGRDGKCSPLPFGKRLLIDVFVGVISCMIAGISLAAGVGGGGLFVPLLMLGLSFDARTATGLSQSMLCGGSAAAFLCNIRLPHPTSPGRRLIDFELACLLAPSLISGTQLGSLLHATVPPIILLVLLCIVLIDAARKGIKNAVKIGAKEREREEQRQQQAVDAAKAAGSTKGDVTAEEAKNASPGQPQSTAVVEGGSSVPPGAAQLGVVWLVAMTVVVTKGLLVNMCSFQWWALLLASSAFLVVLACHIAQQLGLRGKPEDPNELDYGDLAFPLVRWSFLAGVLAAVCGIGGGMVMGPILMGLKVPPPVSSATTATTLLIVSSSTSMVYLCRGLVPRDYSLYLAFIAAGGAILGENVIGRWVRRTGRHSLIVWVLAGITILSAVLMGSLGATRAIQQGAAALTCGQLCHPVNQ